MSVFSDPAYLMRLLALADPSQLQALASQAGDPQIQQAVAQEMQRRQAGPNALRPEDMVQPPPGTPWQGGAGGPSMNLPPTGAPPAGLPPGMMPPGSPPMGGMAEHQSFGESVGNEIAGLHKPAAPGPPGITPRAVSLRGKGNGPSESDVLNMAELARIKARRGMLGGGGGGGGMFGGMGAA